MPGANNGPSNGNFGVTAIVPIVFDTLIFAGAGTQTTRELKADGLPRLNAWFKQTAAAGLGVVTVTLQFADGNTIVGPDWQNLISPYPIAIGVESLTNPLLGSRRYRASVTSDGAATVRYRLTASLC